jgi:protein-arginine kinase activator protein McsA
MSACKHKTLVLVENKNNKLRCHHCHLTISEDELGSGGCPECWETHKVKRRDFERLTHDQNGKTRYCCADCGAVVEC